MSVAAFIADFDGSSTVAKLLDAGACPSTPSGLPARRCHTDLLACAVGPAGQRALDAQAWLCQR